MGGCRCSFRECENSTTNSKGMHFFHYPVKDMDRCRIWTRNAEKEEFLQLPIDKLRNKVVCEIHFKMPMFMNRLKERLIRTAYPTLFCLSNNKKDDKLWDIETNGFYFESPPSIRKLSTDEEVDEFFNPNMDYEEASDYDGEEIDEEENMLDEKTDEEYSPPPIKLIKLQTTERADPAVKILNKSYKNNSQVVPSPNTIKVLNMTPSPKVTVINGVPRVLQKIVFKKPIVKKESISAVVPKQDEPIYNETSSFIEEDGTTTTSITELPIITEDNKLISNNVNVQSPKPSFDESVYALKLEEQKKQIEELKQLIVDNMNKNSANEKKELCESPPKIEKSHLNKVQLFNGIKRYLNPSMVAMLRMEMFGGNDRQYKPDEKTVCIELLKLGSETYKYFADEYRFRLPPIKEVEKWTQEVNEDDLENL